ncbi:MAG: HEAT repeat domain-containing protein [Planctomycetes bacterium]|nr:HEAT repeat domain-containing protein [Planctomycetota bacterium]
MEKGYVVYSKTYLTPLLTYQKPERSQIQSRYSIRLARDEYEPLQIGVYALQSSQALANVRIECTLDLPVTIRTMELRDFWKKVEGYPDLQVPDKGMPEGSGFDKIEPATTRVFWLTFYAAPDAKPGLHKGKIRISADSGGATELDLAVEVLPFVLPKADIPFGMYYYAVGYVLKNRNYQKGVFHDMAAHGMTSIVQYVFDSVWEQDPGASTGKLTLDSTFAQDCLDMQEAGLARQGMPLVFKDYKVAGIEPPPPGVGAQGDAAKASAARQYADHVRRNRLPEFIIYLKDEPSVDQGPEYFEWAAGWKRSPIRTATAMSSEAACQLGYLHDVQIVHMGGISPELIAEAKRAGNEVWTYNHELDHSGPPANRYFSGLYTWGLGLKGNQNWIYFHSTNGYVAPEGGEGPKPKPAWEGRREGVDDYRYLRLLDNCIAARPDSPMAREAAAWLGEVRASTDWSLYHEGAGSGTRDYFQLMAPRLRPDDYDKLRAKAATYILALGVPQTAYDVPPRETSKAAKYEAEPFMGKSVEQCIAGLQSTDIYQRRAAASALALLGKEAAPAASSLADCLGNRDTRLPALRALGAIGPESAAALKPMADLLRHKDYFVRIAVAFALGGIGADAIEPLKLALHDTHPSVIRAAGNAFALMGPAAKPAVPDLISLLVRPSGELRKGREMHSRAATVAIMAIGPGAVDAVPALITYYRSENGNEPYAAEALASIGPAAKDAVPTLDEYAPKLNTHCRPFTLYALFRITGKELYLDQLADTLWTERYGYCVAELFAKLGVSGKPVEAKVRKRYNEAMEKKQQNVFEPLTKALKAMSE